MCVRVCVCARGKKIIGSTRGGGGGASAYPLEMTVFFTKMIFFFYTFLTYFCYKIVCGAMQPLM